MRVIVFFDLPVETNQQKRIYRQFVKYLKNEGYIRLQYAIYSKLCINNEACAVSAKHLRQNAPIKGDVRYMIVTETQYQGIHKINNVYSIQEMITTVDRTVMIGGMNDED